ncbi:MAG: type II toxin-antitoxin system HicB family antitoxin [Desulfuromonadales bacterium]|nr:type II toxin-antitoxin system HicB family antitoxin [Desulfuromonadales bacterium]
MLYPVAIEKGDKNLAFGAIFPDVEGCFSAGDSYEKALKKPVKPWKSTLKRWPRLEKCRHRQALLMIIWKMNTPSLLLMLPIEDTSSSHRNKTILLS